MSTQMERSIHETDLAVPGVGLQVPTALSSTLQHVDDSDGNQSGLELTHNGPVVITTQLGIGVTPAATYALEVAEGKSIRLLMGTGTVVSVGAPGVFNIDAVNIVGGRLTVKDDGKVGINHASPQYTLDVGGTINATAIRVGGGGATIPGIQKASSAPPGAALEPLFVNVNTGVLYYE